MWLHSSVGRASHRYRGGHGFESRWSPDFFQASYFQLLKLENLLRWSLFTSYTTAVQIWIISYMLHTTKCRSQLSQYPATQYPHAIVPVSLHGCWPRECLNMLFCIRGPQATPTASILVVKYLTWPSKFSESLISNIENFYSCLLCDLAFEWQRGWRWPCFNKDLNAFVV